MKENKWGWIRYHADTAVVVSCMFAGLLWMNGKFNEIEKDVAIIRTVLVMKQILPCEIADKGPKK